MFQRLWVGCQILSKLRFLWGLVRLAPLAAYLVLASAGFGIGSLIGGAIGGSTGSLAGGGLGAAGGIAGSLLATTYIGTIITETITGDGCLGCYIFGRRW